ncbi:MAG: hypothetical protein HC814_07430 [Rhodobacteraceae bacterium]|nr:hypothetical protein [Paracoccaceae bacterium]
MLALGLIGLAAVARGETLEYEVYELNGHDKRSLLARGVKEYAVADVRIVERSKGGQRSWSKSVVVWDDFSVGASVFCEQSLEGFGLWIARPGDGFSWDWFDREEQGTFKKLQGGGRVRVTMAASTKCSEFVAVEFLTDVTLRGRFSWWPFSFADTHQIVLKKGSVLRIAP